MRSSRRRSLCNAYRSRAKSRQLGNRTFLYIQGVLHTFDNIERRRGFTDMLKKHGVILSEKDMLQGNFKKDTAYNAMKEYLESGRELPDAIFAGNDSSALGTIEALVDFGLKVLEQVLKLISGDPGSIEVLCGRIIQRESTCSRILA